MPIPNKKIGEKQSEFMIRCVPQVMQYHDKSQAIAICYRSFQGKMINLETYNDYPKSASNNAKKELRWRDKGYVAWLGWGGTSGINWAAKKLQQIDKK